MQKTLAPIIHRDAYTYAVERELLDWFKDVFFIPIAAILARYDVPLSSKYQAIKYDETRLNSVTGAIEAGLASGRIQYRDGIFTGKFSSAITKELRALGATYDGRTQSFSLSLGQVPFNLRTTIALQIEKSKALHSEIISTLATIATHIAESQDLGLNFGPALDMIIPSLDAQLITTFDGLKSITIAPNVTPQIREKLTNELTESTQLAVKNFTKEKTLELRKLAEANAFSGGRSDRLAKVIEAQFGVTKRKANFLADQETGLLVSKYREARYAEAGVKDYIWMTSHDDRVRKDHAALDGKRFSFSNPPITNRSTGARNNPGEDFRCRCAARPIVVIGARDEAA